MSLDLAGVKAGLILIPAACGAFGYLAVKIWRGMAWAVRLRDAILGTPKRGDQDEQPGILSMLRRHGEQLTAIDKELHPNGGSSLRDQIVRVETQIAEVRKDAAEAKQKAADAASEAEGLSGSVARFHHDARVRADTAGRERRGVQESLDVLLRSLAEFASEGHQKERAYVAALQRLGIDLTNVTAELESEATGGTVDLTNRDDRDAR